MKWSVAVFAYVAALLVVAATAFVVVLVVAGPHAGLLPEWAETIVLILGWLAVVVLPFLVAHRVWRRLHRGESAGWGCANRHRITAVRVRHGVPAPR